MVKHLTNADFNEAVSEGVVLVDFWADWCMPCKMLATIIDELAEKYDSVSFFKVNVDEEGGLAADFGVLGIPTIIIFKDGEVVETLVGVRPVEEFASALNGLV